MSGTARSLWLFLVHREREMDTANKAIRGGGGGKCHHNVKWRHGSCKAIASFTKLTEVVKSPVTMTSLSHKQSLKRALLQRKTSLFSFLFQLLKKTFNGLHKQETDSLMGPELTIVVPSIREGRQRMGGREYTATVVYGALSRLYSLSWRVTSSVPRYLQSSRMGLHLGTDTLTFPFRLPLSLSPTIKRSLREE